MKRYILFAPVLFLLTLAACQKEVDFSPRKPNYDRDVCHVCKMGITDAPYEVQAINERGEVRWYDDIGCLAEDMREHDFNKWKGQKYKIWINDAETGEWIDAEKAWYRFGDETPMGYGYGALKEKTADTLYDFKTVIQRINEGKTKRAEFLKKKKMSVSGGDGGMKCGGGMKCAPGKCGGGK
jgi:copper chaperone NosL